MNTSANTNDQLPNSDTLSAGQLTPPPRRSALYRTFLGPQGVRAGWKVFLFFLIFGLLAAGTRPLITMVVGKIDEHAPLPAGSGLLSEFLGMTAVLLATWVMARFIDRKPWGYFGMPLRNAFRSSFWIGSAVGLGALALQLEIMHLGGWFDFGTMQLHGAAILKYGVVWGLAYLCVGFTEEGVLRGYVQRVTTDGFSRLPHGWSFWTAAILFSVIFGSGHLGNPGENKFGIVMVFIDGMVMCFSLWRTGDLWWAIGNHAAWDWGETFLFGTPNSGLHGANALMHPAFHGPLLLAGGTDGPEGSVLVLISEAIFVLSVAVIYRKRRYPLISDTQANGVVGGNTMLSTNNAGGLSTAI
jgi:membrane protease YdiL (CAAX protease family)